MAYGNYPDLKEVKRVLVVKMRHHGDVLLTSPIFSNLKRAIPNVAIDALIYRDTLPMLEGHPDISTYLLYDRKWKTLSFFGKLRKELSLLHTIRKAKYDMVINLTEGDRGAIAAWVSGAKICVGFDPEGKGFKGKKKIYSHMVKNCKTPRHTVEKQLDVLRRIGIFSSPEQRDLYLHIPQEAIASMQKKLDAAPFETKGFVLIHPVSRWRFKCPPPSVIARLICALHAKGYPVVISSGPDQDEIAMAREIVQKAQGCHILNLAGQTSLKELGALVQLSRTLICVDSVPLHMASALKTPVVALFGPSSDLNWGPWMHDKARVVAQPFSCRPCFMDGCGGSKMSDCLYTLPVPSILQAFQELQTEVFAKV
jgi:heptosyltransferase-3